MKQSHLAELLEVAQTTISRWENGATQPTAEQLARLERIFHRHADPASDAGLKRLIANSSKPVHLICDRSHRLLAVSRLRLTEWRGDPSDLMGQPLLRYASPEILAAEATLDRRGWFDTPDAALTFDTGPNHDPDLRIVAGTMTWERIVLSDGSFGRITTSETPIF